ncbi:hypothetical protein B296_00022149 [Ensete ventricosum]|uniref:Uncharacterized protein n=1 Tax=Ensete ventricosum TaxID=4639 RepID=A0A426YYH9_ENSVE|nr:hypothetical protein B296_00022149 [Ensete ventricosum]
MASVDLIGAKLEAFETRIKDKLHALFVLFRLGRSPSPRRSQRGESSNQKENPPEKAEQATDSSYPCTRVDFPRWEEDGDPTGWVSLVGRYFRYHRTPEASMVDVVAIHLRREAIQCYLLRATTRKRLNQDARRTKATTRPVGKPSAPSTINRPPEPKKLLREELRDRSVKGLYWHCNELWSRDRHCKKGRLLMIEHIEESKHENEDLEQEENTKEDPQPANCTTHALVNYANPQTIKVEGFRKQQPVTILIESRSTNNFMNSKVATRLMLQNEDYSWFDVKEMKPKEIKDTNPLPQLAEISGASIKPSRLPPIRRLNSPTLKWPKEPLANARPNCCPHPQKTEVKRITQEMTKTQIIQPCFFLATTLHPYSFVSRDMLYMKCYIPPNLPWFLMRHCQISGDFPQERTMMLESREDDSAQIHPPDISADEKVHVQLMIAWDRKIAMHHRPDSTTTDGEIQDNVGPQDHGAPTVDTTRKLQEEL